MKVTIYSTPTCPWCKKTKEFFEENDVEFTDIDVSTDQKAAQEMIEKSGQMGVPVVVIQKDDEKEEDEVIIGFDEKKLTKILEL